MAVTRRALLRSGRYCYAMAMLISAASDNKWMEQVYAALLRDDHMELVWDDGCGFAVAPADGQSYQDFLMDGFRNALLLVEKGGFSLSCTPRFKGDLGVELAEILDSRDDPSTDWTIVDAEDGIVALE